MNKHLPEYLTMEEDLCWILLRTILWGCCGAILLVIGIAIVGLLGIAIDHGTLRPSELLSIARDSRQNVFLSLVRVGVVGRWSLAGIVSAFVLEQLLMIKAYLRVLCERSKAPRRKV